MSASKTYDDWKKIKIWNGISTLDPKQKASQVFLSLTGEAEDAVLELEEAEIFDDGGLDKILERLDALYKKDETLQKFQYFEEFESYKRASTMTILQHIVKFDQLYNKVKRYGSEVSDDLLAFKLLKTANLSPANEKLAKATGQMKYSEMKTQLKKIFTENADMMLSPDASDIKVEDVHCAEDEEIYFNRQRNVYNPNASFPRRTFSSPSHTLYRNRPGTSAKKGRNPLDHQGKIIKCHYCESINHLINACPDRQQHPSVNRTFSLDDYSSENHGVNFSYDEAGHDLLLFQTYFDHPNLLEGLLPESWNCAVLDCGASKTVCGKAWLERYKNSLPYLDQRLPLTRVVVYIDLVMAKKFHRLAM